MTNKYGNAVVVFDGYEDDPSPKDCNHQRRVGDCIGWKVSFTVTMTLRMKREEFLSKEENKQIYLYAQ